MPEEQLQGRMKREKNRLSFEDLFVVDVALIDGRGTNELEKFAVAEGGGKGRVNNVACAEDGIVSSSEGFNIIIGLCISQAFVDIEVVYFSGGDRGADRRSGLFASQLHFRGGTAEHCR